MRLEKAISIISFKFQEGKRVYINEKDIDAINTILDCINKEKAVNLESNQLFAKLYIYHLNKAIIDLKVDVLSDVPQQDISRILDTPLAFFYSAFQRELYSSQITNVVEQFKKSGIPMTNERLKERYNLEFITNKLNHMITEALNRFQK